MILSIPWWSWPSCNVWSTCTWYFKGRIIWWYSTLLLMYNQCRTPYLNVNLSKCGRYFHTALDLILEMADVFNFSPAVTYWQTYPRIESFFYSSTMSSGVTWLRTDTELSMPWISCASSSSIIGCIAQLIDCASFLRSYGTLVVFRYWSTVMYGNVLWFLGLSRGIGSHIF